MTAPYTIISFISDFKQMKWQQASNGDLAFRKLSRDTTLFTLLMMPLLGRYDAVIFRYLNDSHNIAGILRRLLVETLICAVAKSRGVDVIWFAHNVDRESTVRYPSLNTLRRKMIGRFTNRVLVTDVSLIPEARKLLPVAAATPILACTFGHMEIRIEKPVKGRPDADIDSVPEGKSFYVASVNNWTDKKRPEFDLLLSLSRKALADNLDDCFIIAGPQTIKIRDTDPALYEQLKSIPNICLLEGEVQLKQLVDAGKCHAIVKSYTDMSLSLTLFQACSLGLAIISEQGTFMGAFIENNNVGVSIDPDSIDIAQTQATCLEIIKDSSNFTRFFSHYSWERGAAVLCGKNPA